jgi:hypothetical protein
MASGSPELSPDSSRITPDTNLVNPNEERTMSTSPAENACGFVRGLGSARRTGPRWELGSTWHFWAQHREASLNWLALGLLLAAWNASDNDTPAQLRRRPEALRGYSSVSVRAAHRTLSANLTLPANS